MILNSWDLVLNHVLPWLLQTASAAAVAFVAFVVLLPTKIGEGYLKFRFEKELEQFKDGQNRQIESLREQLNHLGDRGKRSNEMEFAAIKSVWEKFVEAFLATSACVALLIQIPAFESMSDEEFESFLTTTGFSDAQKFQMRNATDRKESYSSLLLWRAIWRAQNENFEARLLLRKQGIFMPANLKDQFRAAIDVLVATQIEQQVSQHKDSGIGYEKRIYFSKEGEAIFDRLSALANQRLFRNEVGDQQIVS